MTKSVLEDGRFSFYAFNALDRRGRFGSGNIAGRLFPAVRFGAELSLPLTDLRALGSGR